MTKSLAPAFLLSGALVLAFFVCGAVAWAQSDTTSSTALSNRAWRAQDTCAKKAFKQFPDYTPESNAKREQARRLCLATGNLPPRNETPVPASEPAGGPEGAPSR